MRHIRGERIPASRAYDPFRPYTAHIAHGINSMDSNIVDRAAMLPFLEIPSGTLVFKERMLAAKANLCNPADGPLFYKALCRIKMRIKAKIQHQIHTKPRFLDKPRNFLRLTRIGAKRLIRNDMLSRTECFDHACTANTVVITDRNRIHRRIGKKCFVAIIGEGDTDLPLHALFGFQVCFECADDLYKRALLRALIKCFDMRVAKACKCNANHCVFSFSFFIR